MGWKNLQVPYAKGDEMNIYHTKTRKVTVPFDANITIGSIFWLNAPSLWAPILTQVTEVTTNEAGDSVLTLTEIPTIK